jgi:prophage regulatory protein
MSETYLSDVQVAARYQVHRGTIRRWANSALTFPKPVKLSEGCTRWRLSDIVAWEAKTLNA